MLQWGLEVRWEETWWCFIVLGNCQLKDIMKGQVIHFWVMFYLGLVPFKITDVIAVWTSLSILFVCACPSHKKMNSSRIEMHLVFVSLHSALSLAYKLNPWWCSPNWRELQICSARKLRHDLGLTLHLKNWGWGRLSGCPEFHCS